MNVSRIPGKPLVIEEIEVEPPKAWEVRIKILCTSLCHSDVTFWKSSTDLPKLPLPVIFGHEAVGDCKSSKSNTCSKFGRGYRPNMPRDGTSRFRELKGDVIHHFLNISSFTEYTVVDITHVVKITPHIPLGIACLLTCGVSTGVGAAWKVAGVEVGSTVAIFGLGAVGLAVAEGARLNRASKIIGVDINPEKFEIGKKFGITDFINPATCGDKTVSQVIKEMTDGGADYCFECIGLASVMNDAFNSSREGWGKTVILGVEMHGSPISLNSIEILKGRSVCGTFFGGLKPKSDIATLAQKYLDKELNLDEFITHEVSFHDINKAFDLLLEGKIAAMVFGARFVRRTAASRGFRRGLLPVASAQLHLLINFRRSATFLSGLQSLDPQICILWRLQFTTLDITWSKGTSPVYEVRRKVSGVIEKFQFLQSEGDVLSTTRLARASLIEEGLPSSLGGDSSGVPQEPPKEESRNLPLALGTTRGRSPFAEVPSVLEELPLMRLKRASKSSAKGSILIQHQANKKKKPKKMHRRRKRSKENNVGEKHRAKPAGRRPRRKPQDAAARRTDWAPKTAVATVGNHARRSPAEKKKKMRVD
ncbi:alcohol dehydrogenase-like 2 [Citrus sinensis]|uniref:Alcohol dehydrogenase-like 2 n=1 Tax=Citrus sinensis TaxID=2711 RepID=A0ACB8KQ54_CITSI|nr:alcohol dehydrogenase-like 2 [Citrus sinensis]